MVSMTACKGNYGTFCHYVKLIKCQKIYHYCPQRSTAYLKYKSFCLSLLHTFSYSTKHNFSFTTPSVCEADESLYKR